MYTLCFIFWVGKYTLRLNLYSLVLDEMKFILKLIHYLWCDRKINRVNKYYKIKLRNLITPG